MPPPPAVCNTTPLLYLGRIDQLSWLSYLYHPLYVPQAVVLELDVGRMIRADTIDPRQLSWATLVDVSPSTLVALPESRLGRGEMAVIAYAHQQAITTVILDDLQARRFAKQLGLRVIGTAGLLLKAKQQGYISVVHPYLDAVRQEGFRLSSALYHQILILADEA